MAFITSTPSESNGISFIWNSGMPLGLSYNITKVVIVQGWGSQNHFKCQVANKVYILEKKRGVLDLGGWDLQLGRSGSKSWLYHLLAVWLGKKCFLLCNGHNTYHLLHWADLKAKWDHKCPACKRDQTTCGTCHQALFCGKSLSVPGPEQWQWPCQPVRWSLTLYAPLLMMPKEKPCFPICFPPLIRRN